MKHSVKQKQLKNKEEMQQALADACSSTDVTVTKKLVDSMLKRLHQVKLNKGGSTRH